MPVHDDHLDVGVQQAIHEVRADESGSAGHEGGAHPPPSYECFVARIQRCQP